jgi:hypothetical protein
MSELEFVKWAVFGLMGLGIWFMKRTLDKNEERLSATEKEIALIKSDYLHKNDFKDFKLELRSMFEEIRKDIRTLTGPHV